MEIIGSTCTALPNVGGELHLHAQRDARAAVRALVEAPRVRIESKS